MQQSSQQSIEERQLSQCKQLMDVICVCFECDAAANAQARNMQVV